MTLIDALRGRLVSSVSTSACQIARLPGDARVRKAHRNRTHDLYTEDFHASHQPRRISNAFHGTRCTAAHGTRYTVPTPEGFGGCVPRASHPTDVTLLYSGFFEALVHLPVQEGRELFPLVAREPATKQPHHQHTTTYECRREEEDTASQAVVSQRFQTPGKRVLSEQRKWLHYFCAAGRHCGGRRKRGNHTSSPTATQNPEARGDTICIFAIVRDRTMQSCRSRNATSRLLTGYLIPQNKPPRVLQGAS